VFNKRVQQRLFSMANIFPLNSGTQKGHPPVLFLLNIVVQILTSKIRKKPSHIRHKIER
jgi:hypothetical protein